MRKLIIIGILSVVAMIVWIGYLKYDTQRFIKELPSTLDASSSQEQQAKNTVKEDTAAPPDSIIESTTGDEKASQLPTEGGPAETSEDGKHPDRRSNTETGGDVLESGGTPADTKLSPEIVALYTDLQPIYDEYAMAGWEYMQVMTKMHASANRKKEIIQEQTSNPETAQELRQLQTWINENYSSYKELSDEADRRADALQTLIESRGFSYRHFDWKAFFKWRGQSK